MTDEFAGIGADKKKNANQPADSVEFDFGASASFTLSEPNTYKKESAAKGGESVDEFDIPDSDASSDVFRAGDYVSTIWRPYVPRFTEITENTYHFADNSAQRTAKESGNEDSTKKSETVTSKSASSPTVKVERLDASEIPHTDTRSNPTSEFTSTVPDAVVVNISGGGSAKNDTINVFKFPSEKSENTDITPDAEELARREITGLTGHLWQNTDTADKSDEAPDDASANEDFIPDNTPLADEEAANKKEKAYIPFVAPADYDYEPNGVSSADTAKANDASEYNSPSMKDSFKDKFLDSIMSIRIRMIVAVLLGVFTLVYEILPSSIVGYFGLGGIYNAIPFIDLALIIGMALISLPEILRGIKALLSGVIAPEFSSVISALALCSYSLYLVLASPPQYVLLGSVYAVSVINSIIATSYIGTSEFASFRVISSRGEKQIVDCKMTRMLETHNHSLDGIVDEYKSRCAKVFDTKFVGGFFANSKSRRENTKNNIIILALALGVALVTFACVCFISGFVNGFAAFALTNVLAFPALSLLSHKLPQAFAMKKMESSGGAFIGEDAMYAYSGVDVIVFEDTDVFGIDDVTLKSARDKTGNYHESMRKMSSLFNAVGGPLSVVFGEAVNRAQPPATEVTVEDGGISGWVDGHLIVAGSADYMHEKGIAVVKDSALRIGSTRVVYAAEDGELFATYTVNYSFSEEFAHMLSAMREEGIVPLVYTRDFNIDNGFMRGLTGGADVIRVMRKYDTAKENEPYSRVNATLVTEYGKDAAVDAIVVAKKYARLQSWISVMEISAAASGAVLAVAISLCGMTFTLPIALLAMWQIGWGIVMGVVSRRNFSISKKKETCDVSE